MKSPRTRFHFMAVAQWRQMPHFWNGKCNLLKANKIFFFSQHLSKFTPFASLYSDPAYGRDCIPIHARNMVEQSLMKPGCYNIEDLDTCHSLRLPLATSTGTTELCNIYYQHLITNLLYYDYKCICFINLLVGHYRIYGALIQGPLWKKVVHYERNGAKF